ncbi:MAG: HPF/RaiA family ribosome-associated protein [Acidobacteriota bacterium]
MFQIEEIIPQSRILLRRHAPHTHKAWMPIQTNTDRSIAGSDGLSAQANTIVESALGRFSGRITRAEIYLSDKNGASGGVEDKRCMMEARLEGRQPIAVTHRAATVEQAMKGAANKLKRAIGSTIGRLRDGEARTDTT